MSAYSRETEKRLGLLGKMKENLSTLRSYTRNKAPTIGEVKVPVKFGSSQIRIKFEVVEQGSKILNTKDCVNIGLLKWLDRTQRSKEMIREKSKVKIIKNYFSLFKFNLELKPNYIPFVSREHPLAYAVRPQVSKELECLEDEGILVKTKHTDWCSPIVVIKKKQGSLRICGDFRHLNQELIEDKYLLPSIEDLLARLGSGNKIFAKMDLKSAYHQIRLSEDASQLTTIITPQRDL